jgi:hypothetical protein
MIRKFYLFLTCHMILVLYAANGQGSPVTITDSIVVTPATGIGTDVYIATGYPACDSVGSEILIADWTQGGIPAVWRTYMKFDLSGIPTGANIQSGTLFLYADSASALGYTGQPTYGSNNAGVIYRVTSSWNKNTVSDANQPSTTTTNSVSLAQSTSTTQNYAVDMTDMVVDWLSSNNYGFMMKHVQETAYYNSMIFHSSRSPRMDKRPTLKIVYTYITNGIKEQSEAGNQLMLYPNPGKGIVNLKGRTNGAKELKIEIINAVGQLVYNEKLMLAGAEFDRQIDLSKMENGVYLLRYDMDGKAKNTTFTIVK